MSIHFHAFKNYILQLQHTLCSKLSQLDHSIEFKKKQYQRNNPLEGGGIAMYIDNGNIIERGAVCVSYLNIELNEQLSKQLQKSGTKMHICGISSIIHPMSPFIPTAHFNYRYVELETDTGLKWWFGGGIDLTPYYIDKTYIIKFHKDLQSIGNLFHPLIYKHFKEQADKYFYIPHRHEHRGIGGIFFDHLNSESEYALTRDKILLFIQKCNAVYFRNYIPMIQYYKTTLYSQSQKDWQLLRRSRYVEFNLLYDRGTKFGFNTPNANHENILLSMPPNVSWKYNDIQYVGLREQELINVLKNPIDWANLPEAPFMIKYIKRIDQSRIPVWLMRQAGRYLPEYHTIRCATPELASEITLQPVRRFNNSAAIIFSDILVVLKILGFNIEIVKSIGPVIQNPLKNVSDIDNFTMPDVKSKLQYVFDAITLTKQKMLDEHMNNISLIGFCGAPWTLFTYMLKYTEDIDSNKSRLRAKEWMKKYPTQFHICMKLLTEISVKYLYYQVEAGADIVQIFDTWAGCLNKDDFIHNILPYLEKINTDLKEICNVPTILFTKGTFSSLEDIFINTSYDIISIDDTILPSTVRKIVGNKCIIQGNFSPKLLENGTKDEIKYSVNDMIKGFKSNLIANLGHGIIKTTPIDNVATFVNTVKKKVYLRVGTRSSILAMWQTNYIINQLINSNINNDISIKIIKIDTIGDKNNNIPFHEIKQTGIFVKELDTSLINNDIDFVVHSLKDMETTIDPELELITISKRDNPSDLFISYLYDCIEKMPKNTVIGTASCRRKAQTAYYNPTLITKNIRGNVETRISKLKRHLNDKEHIYDAIIMSYCGIYRLNLHKLPELYTQCLEHRFYAPGQGCIAVVIRKNLLEKYKLFFKNIHCIESYYRITAERDILKYTGQSCTSLIAVQSNIVSGCEINVSVELFSDDYSIRIYTNIIDHYTQVGKKIVDKIRQIIMDEYDNFSKFKKTFTV